MKKETRKQKEEKKLKMIDDVSFFWEVCDFYEELHECPEEEAPCVHRKELKRMKSIFDDILSAYLKAL